MKKNITGKNFMEINNISTADCEIENMVIEDNKIEIIFKRLYNIKDKIYMNNVNIIINNWKKLDCREYILKSPFEKGYWIENEQNIKNKRFEMIQEIENNNGKIILRGFCKETGNWMEYIIEI
jgi:hypothetical protein